MWWTLPMQFTTQCRIQKQSDRHTSLSGKLSKKYNLSIFQRFSFSLMSYFFLLVSFLSSFFHFVSLPLLYVLVSSISLYSFSLRSFLFSCPMLLTHFHFTGFVDQRNTPRWTFWLTCRSRLLCLSTLRLCPNPFCRLWLVRSKSGLSTIPSCTPTESLRYTFYFPSFWCRLTFLFFLAESTVGQDDWGTSGSRWSRYETMHTHRHTHTHT